MIVNAIACSILFVASSGMQATPSSPPTNSAELQSRFRPTANAEECLHAPREEYLDSLEQELIELGVERAIATALVDRYRAIRQKAIEEMMDLWARDPGEAMIAEDIRASREKFPRGEPYVPPTTQEEADASQTLEAAADAASLEAGIDVAMRKLGIRYNAGFEALAQEVEAAVLAVDPAHARRAKWLRHAILSTWHMADWNALRDAQALTAQQCEETEAWLAATIEEVQTKRAQLVQLGTQWRHGVGLGESKQRRRLIDNAMLEFDTFNTNAKLELDGMLPLLWETRLSGEIVARAQKCATRESCMDATAQRRVESGEISR